MTVHCSRPTLYHTLILIIRKALAILETERAVLQSVINCTSYGMSDGKGYNRLFYNHKAVLVFPVSQACILILTTVRSSIENAVVLPEPYEL